MEEEKHIVDTKNPGILSSHQAAPATSEATSNAATENAEQSKVDDSEVSDGPEETPKKGMPLGEIWRWNGKKLGVSTRNLNGEAARYQTLHLWRHFSRCLGRFLCVWLLMLCFLEGFAMLSTLLNGPERIQATSRFTHSETRSSLSLHFDCWLSICMRPIPSGNQTRHCWKIPHFDKLSS